MGVEDVQLSGVMRLRRLLSYVLLFLMILVPILWSGIIRIVMSEQEFSQIISFFKDCFWHGEFWVAENDPTLYLIVLLDNGGLLGALMTFHGVACFIAGIALVYMTIKTKMKHLIPFTIPYSVLAILLFLAGCGDYTLHTGVASYNILMLYGSYCKQSSKMQSFSPQSAEFVSCSVKLFGVA